MSTKRQGKKRSHAFIFLFLSSNAMKESTKRGKRCKAYALDKLTGKLNRQQRHINDAHNTKCWNDACDKKAVFSDFYFIRKWVLFSFSSSPIFFSSHLFLIDVLCALQSVSLYILKVQMLAAPSIDRFNVDSVIVKSFSNGRLE